MKKLFPVLIVVALAGCKKFQCRECTVIVHDKKMKVYYPASHVSMCGKSKSEVSKYEKDHNFSNADMESTAVCE